MCKENCKYWSTMLSYTAWRHLNLCLLSVFKSLSAWFTQTVEIVISFGYSVSWVQNLCFVGLWPLPAIVQCKEFIKQYQRHKICSSVAEDVPTPPQAHSPSCRAEPTAPGFISNKVDISRLVCDVHCRQYLQDLCVNLLVQAWCKQPSEQLGFCPVTVLITCLGEIKVRTYLGSLSWRSSVNIPSCCPVCYWTLFQRCEGYKHPGDRSSF